MIPHILSIMLCLSPMLLSVLTIWVLVLAPEVRLWSKQRQGQRLKHGKRLRFARLDYGRIARLEVELLDLPANVCPQCRSLGPQWREVCHSCGWAYSESYSPRSVQVFPTTDTAHLISKLWAERMTQAILQAQLAKPTMHDVAETLYRIGDLRRRMDEEAMLEARLGEHNRIVDEMERREREWWP